MLKFLSIIYRFENSECFSLYLFAKIFLIMLLIQTSVYFFSRVTLTGASSLISVDVGQSYDFSFFYSCGNPDSSFSLLILLNETSVWENACLVTFFRFVYMGSSFLEVAFMKSSLKMMLFRVWYDFTKEIDLGSADLFIATELERLALRIYWSEILSIMKWFYRPSVCDSIFVVKAFNFVAGYAVYFFFVGCKQNWSLSGKTEFILLIQSSFRFLGGRRQSLIQLSLRVPFIDFVRLCLFLSRTKVGVLTFRTL